MVVNVAAGLGSDVRKYVEECGRGSSNSNILLVSRASILLPLMVSPKTKQKTENYDDGNGKIGHGLDSPTLRLEPCVNAYVSVGDWWRWNFLL